MSPLLVPAQVKCVRTLPLPALIQAAPWRSSGGGSPGLLSLLLSWCGQELALRHPAPHLLHRPPSASLPAPPPPSPGEPSGLDRRPLRLGPRLVLGPRGPGLLSPALLSWDALLTGLPALFWPLAQQPECSLKGKSDYYFAPQGLTLLQPLILHGGR